jgi:hypothetical protein
MPNCPLLCLAGLLLFGFSSVFICTFALFHNCVLGEPALQRMEGGEREGDTVSVRAPCSLYVLCRCVEWSPGKAPQTLMQAWNRENWSWIPLGLDRAMWGHTASWWERVTGTHPGLSPASRMKRWHSS